MYVVVFFFSVFCLKRAAAHVTVAALSARVLFLFTNKYLSSEIILSVSLLTFSGKVTDTHFNYIILLESFY